MRTLTQAVREKYNGEDDGWCDAGIVLYVPRSSPRQRLPSVLILDHCDIDSVGDQGCLSSDCSNVRELDLSHNSITQWEEVNKLIGSLPNLTFLNLSFNPLRNANIIAPQASFPSLRQLVLNGSGIQWHELAPYLMLAPNLKELHLSFNRMEVPQRKEDGFIFAEITTLHYDGNCVENRDHLTWISQTFPSLTTLVLCECPLWTLRWTSSATSGTQGLRVKEHCSGYGSADSAWPDSVCLGDGKSSACCRPLDPPAGGRADDAAPDGRLFASVRSVSLNHCHIDCWEELAQLCHWPSLTELRLQSCPLFRKMTDQERRHHTIARLPNVQRLNGGCDITALEREEAERIFIRHFQDQVVQPDRFRELAEIYGQLAPLVDVCLNPPRTADVWVRWGEQRWQEKVQLQLSLKQLKERISRVVGIPASRLRVIHLDHASQWSYYMIFPAKRLHSYNVLDGHEFIVDEKL